MADFIDPETFAFDVFASDLKRWMVKEQLGHDSIVGRCRAVIAHCDEMDVKQSGSYYPALKKLVQQFLTLLTGDVEYML
jgi:hypothetical protein